MWESVSAALSSFQQTFEVVPFFKVLIELLLLTSSGRVFRWFVAAVEKRKLVARRQCGKMLCGTISLRGECTQSHMVEEPSHCFTLHNHVSANSCFYRLIHRLSPDVQFEEDDDVMPLMSAAKIWSKLEVTVADESVFKDITFLLYVQSVAVCLEKGQKPSASSALKWFANNYRLPKNMGVRLSKIVTQRETYHPLLMSFSFRNLLDTVQSYVDTYLEKNPSDHLLKEATKTVLSSPNSEGLKEAVTLDGSVSETADESIEDDLKKKERVVCHRTKRKLLSTKITDVWKPDSCKKSTVSMRRLSKNELSRVLSEKSMDSTEIQKKRKARQKWTPQLDRNLKAGVKQHGQGKWSQILLDYDFEGRTGTMLKDRWRVLKRAHEVS
ncbi:putative telomeric repeat-binding factor 1 [Scophthalmus maximus]|uniref:Putative telomeric repeat-binding factor 1 n=1 Tax=Scophthalmus maximus TaxID=52904 RepID=A0A2U9CX43_SCOMX|nr:putative telomeric repeat-binding factor 1 [Scophthalmus maximus]